MSRRAAEPIGRFAPGSEEWREARRAGLGGSEIAAVLGLSPWVSRFSLWHRKAGTVGPQDDTPAMSWGRRLEGPIADQFAEDHPEWSVRRTGMWRSKARPWQIANPDRLIHGVPGGPAILEVKTAHAMDTHEWGPHLSDQVPVYYRPQCLWYLDVLGYQRCYVAVLIGGSDYRELTVEYDLTDAHLMREQARRFLDSLESGEQPDIDESLSTYQTVRKLHPDIDRGTDVEIPAVLADAYRAALATYATAAARKSEVVSRVLDAMGSAHYATCCGERVAQRVAIGDHAPHLRPVTKREAAA